LSGFTVPFTIQLIGVNDQTEYLIATVTNLQPNSSEYFYTLTLSNISISTNAPELGDALCVIATQDGRDAGCQFEYQYSPGAISPTGYFTSFNNGFSGGPFQLSFTGSNGNNWTNYLTGHTGNFALVVTSKEDPNIYLAFQTTYVNEIISAGYLLLMPNGATQSASLTNPAINDTLCIDITPLNDSRPTTSCATSSPGINFSATTIGSTISTSAPYGLGLNVGDTLHIYDQNLPNVLVQISVTSYVEDNTVIPYSASVTGTTTVVVNQGSTNVLETDLCFVPFPNTDNFIFRRTLFVDMNGDDTIGASVTPVGGILNPPFATIQGAIDYIDNNLSSFQATDVTIHVFAGTYNVSTGAAGDTGPGPIELGYATVPNQNTRVHLYLEDGVYIQDTTSVVGGTANDPKHLFLMRGSYPSITGYGVIRTGGVVGSNFCDVIRLEEPIRATIQLRRINHNFRENIGKTFRHIRTTSNRTTEVYFEGEVLISNVNGALLHNKDSYPLSTNPMTFEFGHNTIINILGNDSTAGTNMVVQYSGTNETIVRGDWYHQPASDYSGRIFWYFDDDVRYIFDGADIYLNVGDDVYNNFMVSTGITGCIMEVRESSFSNGYIDNTYPIYNQSFGIFQQGVNIRPNKLDNTY